MRRVATKLSAITLLFLLIFGWGCQKEAAGPGGNDPVVPLDSETVSASVRGVVVDAGNNPVTGATVTSGTQTTTTDKYGVFRFNNISLSKNNGYVKVTKPGYFNGSRSFISVAGRTHNVRIKLITKTNSGSFQASAGGTVTLSDGSKLVMPASAITDASGAAYSGTVNVAMIWIDPTSTDLSVIMPGDLRGITTSNEERGLQTFGMLGVELTGASGQDLKIASGKTAELSFPIPAGIAGSAPATIDLWHFDETAGRWKQDGQATKTGSYYVAQVSHFSFWNCDAPFPLVDLCMTLVNSANNLPLNNVQVRIKRTNGSYASGWTDSTGRLCGKVPKNEALVLEVLDQCHAVVYTQNIGPFSSNTDIGTISATIPAANNLVISGTVVNCSNTNVTHGTVVIYVQGAHSYSVPVTNGTFSFSLVRCASSVVHFSVLGIDYATMQQGPLVSGSGTTGSVNMGTIQACGTSASQFAEYIIDGVPYSFTAPPDHFNCGDSTGNWNGFTTRTSFSGFKGTTNTAVGGFSLVFYNNGQAGTFPIQSGHMQYTASVQALQFTGPGPVVTITAHGAPGGFIEGGFTEMMMVSGTPKSVACTFRIRRN